MCVCTDNGLRGPKTSCSISLLLLLLLLDAPDEVSGDVMKIDGAARSCLLVGTLLLCKSNWSMFSSEGKCPVILQYKQPLAAPFFTPFYLHCAEKCTEPCFSSIVAGLHACDAFPQAP